MPTSRAPRPSCRLGRESVRTTLGAGDGGCPPFRRGTGLRLPSRPARSSPERPPPTRRHLAHPVRGRAAGRAGGRRAGRGSRRVSAFAAATIVTERLLLVPLRPEDADEMVDVLADPGLHQFIGGHPATLEELRARHATLTGRAPHVSKRYGATG